MPLAGRRIDPLDTGVPTGPSEYLLPPLHHGLPALEKHSAEVNDEMGQAETAIHHPASRKVGPKQTALVRSGRTGGFVLAAFLNRISGLLTT